MCLLPQQNNIFTRMESMALLLDDENRSRRQMRDDEKFLRSKINFLMRKSLEGHRFARANSQHSTGTKEIALCSAVPHAAAAPHAVPLPRRQSHYEVTMLKARAFQRLSALKSEVISRESLFRKQLEEEQLSQRKEILRSQIGELHVRMKGKAV